MPQPDLMTYDEAQQWVADYEANRCPCGGSPPSLPGGLHATEWHDKNGWPDAQA